MPWPMVSGLSWSSRHRVRWARVGSDRRHMAYRARCRAYREAGPGQNRPGQNRPGVIGLSQSGDAKRRGDHRSGEQRAFHRQLLWRSGAVAPGHRCRHAALRVCRTAGGVSGDAPPRCVGRVVGDDANESVRHRRAARARRPRPSAQTRPAHCAPCLAPSDPGA